MLDQDPSAFWQGVITLAFGLFFTAVALGYCH